MILEALKEENSLLRQEITELNKRLAESRAEVGRLSEANKSMSKIYEEENERLKYRLEEAVEGCQSEEALKTALNTLLLVEDSLKEKLYIDVWPTIDLLKRALDE